MKHDFQVYITSQTNPYLKRKSGLNLTNFYAKVRYPNYVLVLTSFVFYSWFIEFEMDVIIYSN